MPQPTRTRRDAPSPATVAWAAKQSDRRPGVLSGLHRLGGIRHGEEVRLMRPRSAAGLTYHVGQNGGSQVEPG
jgi:hypothetical protein